MTVRELALRLDEEFAVSRFAASEPFVASLPGLYGEGWGEFERLTVPAFRELGNGLLLAGGDLDAAPQAVALAVFPSPAVVARVLADADEWPRQVLIVHHPAHYRADAGWQPVPTRALASLQGAGVSVYAVHSPLDAHGRFGPSANLARALHLNVDGPFYPTDGPASGFVGVAASPVAAVDFAPFCQRVRETLGLPCVDARRHSAAPVARVAVVGGGGHTLPGVLERCADAGCDTYLTGTVIERVPNERWQQANARFLAEAAERHINLIGASHCATEKFAMLALENYLDEVGYTVRFFGCPRPWE